jgi:AbrB family looped-hinge helix DNA binding protein
MSDTATTTLSSRGQVVIPEEIRERLGLTVGTQFVVVAEGDVVIFKVLEPPVVSEFDGLIARARSAAKQVGLKKREVAKAVAKVRASR